MSNRHGKMMGIINKYYGYFSLSDAEIKTLSEEQQIAQELKSQISLMVYCNIEKHQFEKMAKEWPDNGAALSECVFKRTELKFAEICDKGTYVKYNNGGNVDRKKIELPIIVYWGREASRKYIEFGNKRDFKRYLSFLHLTSEMATAMWELPSSINKSKLGKETANIPRLDFENNIVFLKRKGRALENYINSAIGFNFDEYDHDFIWCELERISRQDEAYLENILFSKIDNVRLAVSSFDDYCSKYALAALAQEKEQNKEYDNHKHKTEKKAKAKKEPYEKKEMVKLSLKRYKSVDMGLEDVIFTQYIIEWENEHKNGDKRPDVRREEKLFFRLCQLNYQLYENDDYFEPKYFFEQYKEVDIGTLMEDIDRRLEWLQQKAETFSESMNETLSEAYEEVEKNVFKIHLLESIDFENTIECFKESCKRIKNQENIDMAMKRFINDSKAYQNAISRIETTDFFKNIFIAVEKKSKSVANEMIKRRNYYDK